MEDEKQGAAAPRPPEKPKKTVGQKVRRGCMRVFLFLFLILVALGVMGYFIANMDYSKAEKTGYLVKASKKGFLFKTYEGELSLPGGKGGETFDPAQTVSWRFSVIDDSIYKELLKYQGEIVKLQYVQKIKAMPWQGETDYFVEGVKPVK